MDIRARETEATRPEGSPESGRARHTLLAVWLLLLALTAGSLWLGEVRGAPGATNAALVLGIALAKGGLIAGIYMELRDAPRGWALAMAGVLVALAAILAGLFIA